MKTVVRLQGGLGNQLFQSSYAFGQALDGLTHVYLDVSWYKQRHRTNTPRDYELGEEVGPVTLCELPRWIWRPALGVATSEGDKARPVGLVAQRLGWRLLEGYWQDRGVAMKGWPLMANLMYRNMRGYGPSETQDAVAVHARRGDFVSSAAAVGHGVGDLSQQIRIAREIKDQVGAKRIVIFTDSPNEVRESVLGEEYVSVSTLHGSWSVLRAMADAQGFVMGNSSLSWWAAAYRTWTNPGGYVVKMPIPWGRNWTGVEERLLLPGWRSYQRRIVS